MQATEIRAEWNSDKAAWIATSSVFGRLEIEVATIAELIDCLTVRITEVIGLEQLSAAPAGKRTFILTKIWPVSSQISLV
jgi:hypothetical protein